MVDVAAANMFVKNRNQPGGVRLISERAERQLDRRLDVILVNEWTSLADRIDPYTVHSRRQSRNAVLLKSWFDDVDVEWVKGSEGTKREGVNHQDRDMCVVRYTKRDVKCAAIAFHAPYLGQPRTHEPPIADEYRAYGDVLLTQARVLVDERRVVTVGGDNNARPGGDGSHWPFAIYRRLEAEGFDVARRGLDLVGSKGARPRRNPSLIDLGGTGSDHDVAVVAALEVRLRRR